MTQTPSSVDWQRLHKILMDVANDYADSVNPELDGTLYTGPDLDTAIAQIQAHLAQAVVEARIDELEKLLEHKKKQASGTHYVLVADVNKRLLILGGKAVHIFKKGKDRLRAAPFDKNAFIKAADEFNEVREQE